VMYGIQGISFTILAYCLYHFLRLPNEMGNLRATSTVVLFTTSALWGYLFVPFLLRLPYGKRTFRGYLDDIRLTRVRPFLPLAMLTVSCVLILIVCQGAGSLVYRVVEGKPLSAEFIKQVFNLAAVLPPHSTILYGQMFSSLEEVAFRGVLLTMFLRRYSPRMAVVYSALVFGGLHLATLTMGTPLILVLAQVMWAFLYGLFYGYIFLKSGSLLPPMILHWLSNVFQAQLTSYWGSATPIMQAVLGVVFGYGLAAVLSIIWVRFFAPRWLPPTEPERTP
jgi:membrane protease YdiL (CAAX protease family)